jgi:hypothetical protein
MTNWLPIGGIHVLQTYLVSLVTYLKTNVDLDSLRYKRLWNNDINVFDKYIFVSVELHSVGRADQPIIVDASPPINGTVFDGPLFKEDLQYTKFSKKVSWIKLEDIISNKIT